jgi:hypothetical protein
VDYLLADGWSDITVLDVSDVALNEPRRRIGPNPHVRWVVKDLLTWHPSRRCDIWHDRAVFHFFVGEAEQPQYRNVKNEALAPIATVIVGTFASDGPSQCSGLPVARYDPVARPRTIVAVALAAGGRCQRLISLSHLVVAARVSKRGRSTAAVKLRDCPIDVGVPCRSQPPRTSESRFGGPGGSRVTWCAGRSHRARVDVALVS